MNVLVVRIYIMCVERLNICLDLNKLVSNYLLRENVDCLVFVTTV